MKNEVSKQEFQYEVLIDFPQWSVFKHRKGDILTKHGIHYYGKGTSRSINENEIDNYPEIFKKVENKRS